MVSPPNCSAMAVPIIQAAAASPTTAAAGTAQASLLSLWAATGLHKGGQHLDAGEFLDVVRMPFEEALQKVLHGEIKDSKTQIGLMKYALLRDKA